MKWIYKILISLFLVHGVVWFTLGVLSFFIENNLLIPISMFFNGAILFWLAWATKTKKDWVFSISLIYIIVNLVLTITDQFGLFDLLVLILNVVTLGFLLVYKYRA